MMAVHSNTSAVAAHGSDNMRVFELALGHLSVGHQHLDLRNQDSGEHFRERPNGAHAVVHEEDLSAATDLAQDRLADQAPRRSAQTCVRIGQSVHRAACRSLTAPAAR